MNALVSKLTLSRDSRRKERRGSAIKSAKIVYGGPWAGIIDCLIMDLSSKGARLETILVIDVPEFFVLKFSDGTERRVHKRWSSGHQIGVEFTDDEI